MRAREEPGGSGFVRQSLQVSSDIDSLKSKKNLTLGKVQKKTFSPTIPTGRRIRKETSDASDNAAEKQVQKESKAAAYDRKGKRRERKDVIKSESVFSMGPAVKSTSGQFQSGGAGTGSSAGGGRGAAVVTDQETVKKRSSVKESTASSVPLPKLEDDDSLANPNLQHFFLDSQLPPIRLPLNCGTPSQPNNCASSLKRNVKVGPAGEDISVKDFEAQYLTELLTVADHSPTENYMFMQLPDRLPLYAEPSVPGDDRLQTSGGDGAQAEAFSDVPEGRIGKLTVRKSGKVSLTLGAVSLDVSIGTPCGFLQELVCIRSTPPDCKMTSVGHLSHRLVCTPDFENII